MKILENAREMKYVDADRRLDYIDDVIKTAIGLLNSEAALDDKFFTAVEKVYNSVSYLEAIVDSQTRKNNYNK